MGKLIIVSNRLSISVEQDEQTYKITPSAGGLATGLKSFHEQEGSLWIGWPGIHVETESQKNTIKNQLYDYKCVPVFLTKDMIELYYDGFSNATIWPLFHYFTEYAQYHEQFWEAYVKVNHAFAEAVLQHVEAGDTLWIHDYQLMLLPNILRAKIPDLQIGFFLHIPFPSFEVFRILPWRDEILTGILGADLIGFHTYDYARHFKSSVRRIKGYDVEFDKIHTEQRNVYVDVFPISIDYKLFYNKALETSRRRNHEKSIEQKELDLYMDSANSKQIILSIDRLDYTKGIINRLKAFDLFLELYPQYVQKISLVMLTIPSRTDVEQYQLLRNEVEMIIGSINGKYSSLQWTPIIYFYRTIPFEHLIELYLSASVALLTPLRDGMNLVAKEYIASQIHKKGVLILSEMAGAAKELGEAIIVNPYNIHDVAQAIYNALNIDGKQKITANEIMQNRLQRYDVFAWANDFMKSMKIIQKKAKENQSKRISEALLKKLKTTFDNADKKVLFLDYDGTLQRFFANPALSAPDEAIYTLLDNLVAIKNTEVVIISGRDKQTLDTWFAHKNYNLIAEHGAFCKLRNKPWTNTVPDADLHELAEWKEHIYPILESYIDRTPGTFIEEKKHSLVWHYRKADIELGALRAIELKEDIASFIVNHNLEIMEGKKVIEIKIIGVNKGVAALSYLSDSAPDFILAMGDDWTDEYLFKHLPDDAITIKVGREQSEALYFVDSYVHAREFLQIFTQ